MTQLKLTQFPSCRVICRRLAMRVIGRTWADGCAQYLRRGWNHQLLLDQMAEQVPEDLLLDTAPPKYPVSQIQR